MLVYSYSVCSAFLTRLAGDLTSWRGVVPLLHVDSDEIEQSVECFDDATDIVFTIKSVFTVKGLSIPTLRVSPACSVPIRQKLLWCQGSQGLLHTRTGNAFGNNIGYSFAI